MLSESDSSLPGLRRLGGDAGLAATGPPPHGPGSCPRRAPCRAGATKLSNGHIGPASAGARPALPAPSARPWVRFKLLKGASSTELLCRGGAWPALPAPSARGRHRHARRAGEALLTAAAGSTVAGRGAAPGLGARQAPPWGRCGRPRVRFNFLKGASIAFQKSTSSSTSIASWVKLGPYINSCRAHPRGRVRPLGLSTCCLRAPRGGSLPASRADAWACWRRPGNSTATL